MAKSVFALGMSRRRTNPDIHLVDDAGAWDQNEPRPIRLEPNSTADVTMEIVRLEPPVDPSVPAKKLELPDRQETETRSIEPGIETLMDAERAQLEGLEESWGIEADEKKPLPWGWFALFGILIVSVSAWVLRDVLFAQKQIEVIRLETEEILGMEETSVHEAMGVVKSIRTAIQRFARADSVEEMAQVVRHPERVRPLMEDYYSRKPFAPLGDVEIEDLNPLTLGKHADYWLVFVRRGAADLMEVIVEVDSDAGARIDWETFVNYQPMDWDDYAIRRPAGTSMDFRVHLTPDTLYSHEFQDSERWECYMLTASDSEEILFGYIEKNSPSAEIIRQWFGRHPNHRASMILRLSIPQGLKSPRGVVIDHARSVRWIYIVSPDGDS